MTLISCLFLFAPAKAAGTGFFQSYPKRLAVPKSNPKILLIGNSLTHYNFGNHGIKYVLSNLCNADGINATITDITLSGHYLSDTPDDGQKPKGSQARQFYDRVEQALQPGQHWDYVVLQGHSREAIDRPGELLQSIETYFKPKIDACKAQMVLYMTWAPDADPYETQAGYNRDKRQAQITKVYYSLGEHFNCAVAPSGLAFARTKVLHPEINLHTSRSDLLHPGTLGTYLSASVIYATLFNRDPSQNTFYLSGYPNYCASLRRIASDVTTGMNTSSRAQLTYRSKGYILSKGQSKDIYPRISSGGRVVRWISSNPKVVAADAIGLSGCRLKAVSNGKSTITALLNNNTKVSCDVYVTPTTLKMGAKEKYRLEIPGDFTWKSSNTSVATVSKGIITGKNRGTAVLTGTASSGAVLKITVSVKSAPAAVKVKAVPYVMLGRTAKLSAYVSSGCSASALKYKSSNSAIISIDKNGVMTGKRIGKVTITATSYNGKKIKCTAQCIIPAQKIVCKNVSSDLALKKGSSFQLRIGFVPSNTSIKTLKWTSSNKKVLTVSSKGQLNAVRKGTATITAFSTDGSHTSFQLKVTVK